MQLNTYTTTETKSPFYNFGYYGCMHATQQYSKSEYLSELYQPPTNIFATIAFSELLRKG